MEGKGRKPNWTEKERMLLVEEVEKREGRLFGKFKGSGGMKGTKVKEVAWAEIAAIINS